MALAKAGPVVSDNGNFIIDAPFEESFMRHPLEVSPATASSGLGFRSVDRKHEWMP